MSSPFKNIIKHSAIYSLGNISTKLIGFILLPLYTSYLSTDEYGILALLEISSQILISLFSFNLATGMMRWIAEKKNLRKEKSIIFTTVITTLIISILISLVFIPNNSNLSILFFGTKRFSDYFTLLLLTVSFGIYNLVPLTLMRQYEKSVLFTSLTTLKFTITLLFIIYFIVSKKMGVEGILLGQLLGQLLLALSTIPFIIKNLFPKYDFVILKKMFSYSAPLVISGIFALILTMSDRFLIKFFFNNSYVGIYSLGHKIASVQNMLIIQSFQLGFLPIAYKKLNDANHKEFFTKVLNYYTMVLVFTALSISLFSRELIEILSNNKSYFPAYTVIPIISLAFVMKGIQYVFSLSFHYSKKTKNNATVVIISAIFNLICNFFLIPKFSYFGAGLSLALSFLLMMILTYFWGQKVYRIPYEKSKIVKIVFSGIFLFTISILFSDATFFIRILLKSSLIILFPLIAVFLKILDEQEIKAIKTYFASLLKLNRK